MIRNLSWFKHLMNSQIFLSSNKIFPFKNSFSIIIIMFFSLNEILQIDYQQFLSEIWMFHKKFFAKISKFESFKKLKFSHLFLSKNFEFFKLRYKQ